MAQLYFYVPDTVAEKIEQLARSTGLTTSRYLAKLYCVQNENRSFADQRDRVRRTDRQLLPVR